MTVSTGMNAFLSACSQTTFASLRPLARAVRI
jgi:hypothetical protein